MATKKQHRRLKDTRERESSKIYDAAEYPRGTTTMQFHIPIYVPDRIFIPQPPPRIVAPRSQSQNNLADFKNHKELPSRMRHYNRLKTSFKDPTICEPPFRIPTRPPRSASTPSAPSDFVSVPKYAPGSHNSPPSSSSATEFSEIKASIQKLQIISSSAAIAKCPLCYERVDRDLLQQFEDNNDVCITMRQQSKFCHLHKTQSAEAEWKAKEYPQIDWTNFDRRLARFNNVLEEILKRRRPSYFRGELEQHMKNGNRTLAQSMKSGAKMLGVEVGYYGPKGAMMMSVIV